MDNETVHVFQIKALYHEEVNRNLGLGRVEAIRIDDEEQPQQHDMLTGEEKDLVEEVDAHF